GPQQRRVDLLLPAELNEHPRPVRGRAVPVHERLPRMVYRRLLPRPVELNIAHGPIEERRRDIGVADSTTASPLSNVPAPYCLREQPAFPIRDQVPPKTFGAAQATQV